MMFIDKITNILKGNNQFNIINTLDDIDFCSYVGLFVTKCLKGSINNKQNVVDFIVCPIIYCFVIINQCK